MSRSLNPYDVLLGLLFGVTVALLMVELSSVDIPYELRLLRSFCGLAMPVLLMARLWRSHMVVETQNG